MCAGCKGCHTWVTRATMPGPKKDWILGCFSSQMAMSMLDCSKAHAHFVEWGACLKLTAFQQHQSIFGRQVHKSNPASAAVDACPQCYALKEKHNQHRRVSREVCAPTAPRVLASRQHDNGRIGITRKAGRWCLNQDQAIGRHQSRTSGGPGQYAPQTQAPACTCRPQLLLAGLQQQRAEAESARESSINGQQIVATSKGPIESCSSAIKVSPS